MSTLNYENTIKFVLCKETASTISKSEEKQRSIADLEPQERSSWVKNSHKSTNLTTHSTNPWKITWWTIEIKPLEWSNCDISFVLFREREQGSRFLYLYLFRSIWGCLRVWGAYGQPKKYCGLKEGLFGTENK